MYYSIKLRIINKLIKYNILVHVFIYFKKMRNVLPIYNVPGVLFETLKKKEMIIKGNKNEFRK